MSDDDRRRRTLPKYRLVTRERLAALTGLIEGSGLDAGLGEQAELVRRGLHTVKGEARLMGLSHISRLVHELESLFSVALEGGLSDEHRDKLVEGLDYVGEMIEAPDPFQPPRDERLERLLDQVARAAGGGAPKSPAATAEAGHSAPAKGEPAPPARAGQSAAAVSDRRLALVGKLRVSAAERSAAISEHLEAFDAAAPDVDAESSLAREIHTLKGDSRLLGFELASRVAERTEALLGELVDSREIEALRPKITYGLLLIEQLLNFDPPYSSALEADVVEFVGEAGAELVPAPARAPARALSARPSEPSEAALRSPHVDPAGRAPGAGDGQDGAFVNVAASYLTSLTNIAGDLLVRQEQFGRSLADAERLAMAMLTGVAQAMASGSDAASRGTRRRDLLPRTHALAKELLSTVNRAKEELFEGRLFLGALQNEIREVRMVRVGELFERHARSVRGLAREQKKLVRVVTRGEGVTVDKQVLDQLDELLLHLVRNAVDHGLESPEDRARCGKDERGALELFAREVGGFVEVHVRDDGRGVDLESVRASAVAKRVVSEDVARELDEQATLSLLFAPGFSTRDEMSELSGRGVGLDVVSTKLSELGGSTSIESRLGEGTHFCLKCPVSVAFSSCLVVKAAEELYALPSTSVVEVLDPPPEQLEETPAGRALLRDGKRLPLCSLPAILGVPSSVSRANARAVVVQADTAVALEVDAVIGEREVVRKSLNPFLSGVAMISGTATVEGRRLVMFIHLPELLRIIGGGNRTGPHHERERAPAASEKVRVLVVDDSELTRDMLVPLLERLGYAVSEAVDGADALTAVGNAQPDLLLTDLDMPVMDGFALVQRLRADPATMDMPILVLSTRGSEEDKRRAMLAGASGYLVKSAFRAEDLDKAICQYLHGGSR